MQTGEKNERNGVVFQGAQHLIAADDEPFLTQRTKPADAAPDAWVNLTPAAMDEWILTRILCVCATRWIPGKGFGGEEGGSQGGRVP